MLVVFVCYLKVVEGEVSLSTLLHTLIVHNNSSFSVILIVITSSHLKSFMRIYFIEFSLFLKNEICLVKCAKL